MKFYLTKILSMFNINEPFVQMAIGLSTVFATIAIFSESYLGVSASMASALIIIIVADFITGVLASIKENIKITSNRGLATVYKTGAYILFMYVTFMFYKELEIKNSNIATLLKYSHIYIIGHAVFWELFSVDENLKRLGIELGITDFLKSIYNRFKSLLSNEKD